MKYFNTAGPVNQNEHYKLNPIKRWDLDEILMLITQEKYFILHAPRQTGKTSSLLALQDYINTKNEQIAIYINVESAQAARNNIDKGMKAIVAEIENELNMSLPNISFDKDLQKILKRSGSENGLSSVLSYLSNFLEKPLILFIDEIDSLIGDTLVSVLRQLRTGYKKRPQNFPASIMLSGVVDIKDYRIHRADGEIITGGSCFNIKAASLRLGNFSKEDIKNLYLEHTKETGQKFEDEIYDLAWQYTAGQPWLVNAIAYEVCFNMKENRDRTKTITVKDFIQAKENLILSRQTHLDQLADKLKEERVRKVIQPMLTGEFSEGSYDDRQYCLDLGLIRYEDKKLVISNDIYKEVLPRELTNVLQTNMASQFSPKWVNSDETINTEILLDMFQQFWRENSEIWSRHISGYLEAAPHLVFQGFLQRVGNGHGIIDREYAFGMKRCDLYLQWDSPQKTQRIVFEIKLRTERENSKKKFQKLIENGKEQTFQYVDKCKADEAHLLIFDRREKIKWDEKIYKKEEEFENRKIKIWGM